MKRPGMFSAMDAKTVVQKFSMRKCHLIFGFALALCSSLAGFTIHRHMADERLAMRQALLDECFAIKSVFGKFMLKTHTLGAFVEQNNGNTADFHSFAAALMDSPVIAHMLIAPNGVVTDVYPLAGNEKLLGYSLFDDGAENTEARVAKDSNTLVIAGPFSQLQGDGMAIAGILPINLYLNGGGSAFWGFASIVLKYPEVLTEARLQTLKDQGLTYTLWRTVPETGERQIIAQSAEPPRKGVPSAERRIRIINEDWHLRVSRTQAWYEYPAHWAMAAAALAASLLVAYAVTGNDKARAMKEELEGMTHTDHLTGLLNRKGMFLELKELMDCKERFRLSCLDLNYFKQINAAYGHAVGDYALREFTKRVRNQLGADHIFARTGSAEFIIAYTGEVPGEDRLWRELEREFAQPFSPGTCEEFFLHFSRGDAVYPDDGHTLDELMAHADRAMQEEKRRSYAAGKGRRAEDRDSPA